MTQYPFQDRCIAQASRAHHEAFLFLDLARHKHGDGGRHKGHGKDHGTKKRDDHCKRHGMEHFAFDTGQGEDWQVHDHDD